MYKIIIALLVLLLTSCAIMPSVPEDNNAQQQANDVLQRYQRAEAMLPVNLQSRIDNLYFKANWLDDGALWYKTEQDGGVNYWHYDPNKGATPLFNPNALAKALGESDVAELLKTIKITTVEGEKISFSLAGQAWSCQLNTRYICLEEDKDDDLPGNLVSPDGHWQILVKNHNLHMLEINTGKETQLTFDGSEEFAYATESANPNLFFDKDEATVEPKKVAYWSPDSQYVVTFQLDLRNVGKLHLSQAVTGNNNRPRLYQYHYPMAGDEYLIEGHLVLLDIQSKRKISVATPVLNQTYYGSPLWGEFADNNKYYFLERERGYHAYRLKELSPETGEIRTLITETNKKFIDPWIQDFRILPEQDLLLWTSERNGIQQVFSYQLSTGDLLQEVTPRHLFMRAIKAIDSDKKQLYFEASSKQAHGQSEYVDAYYRHLYRVGLDGHGLTLLTPEPMMHNTQIAPDFIYFTDSFSTVGQAPKHVLRSAQNGQVLTTLAAADAGKLLASGYRPPEPFRVRAKDQKTWLHGILYFPSDFDPNKSYPVLDDIYTGPHGYFTPKTFAGPLWSHSPALAELGFIVLKMDGRGTGKRDRAFHEYSYKNLAGGADDHIWTLQQLAKSRSYLDINRVGIFGFSAGGYDTVRAMYKYPDFFKVGVAASGNHDFRADKAGWNETWMDFPVAEHWDEQSNLTGAGQLKGKLLLAHGELDENVHPAATLQLADKLIKANKDFELMIFPNMGHVLHQHPYFVRKRWDFFIRHLLGVTPPQEYNIVSMSQ